MIHSINRAKERYDVDLTVSDVNEIICNIENKANCKLIEGIDEFNQVYAVFIKCHVLLVVVTKDHRQKNKKRRFQTTLATVLPKEHVDGFMDKSLNRIKMFIEQTNEKIQNDLLDYVEGVLTLKWRIKNED